MFPCSRCIVFALGVLACMPAGRRDTAPPTPNHCDAMQEPLAPSAVLGACVWRTIALSGRSRGNTSAFPWLWAWIHTGYTRTDYPMLLGCEPVSVHTRLCEA
jgi:hypothetical protein